MDGTHKSASDSPPVLSSDGRVRSSHRQPAAWSPSDATNLGAVPVHGVTLAQPRPRRKKQYATVVDYEAALAAAKSLPVPPTSEGQVNSSGEELSSGDDIPGNDSAELSESEDDLLSQPLDRLAAVLVTERPSWTSTHLAKGVKGKGRAQRVHIATEDEGESEIGSGADEYQPGKSDMESSERESEEEVDLDDVAEGMLVGAAAPKAAHVTGAKQGPMKFDSRRAVERPTWKVSQGAAVPLASLVPPPTPLPSATPATGVPPTPPPQQASPVPQAVPALANPVAAAPQAPTIQAVPARAPAQALPGVPPIPAPASQSQPVAAAPGVALLPVFPQAAGVLPNVVNTTDSAGEYHLVPPVNAGAVLSLNSQDPRIRAVMRNTFPRLEAAIVFDNAFPDALGRTKSVVKSLINAAEHLNLPGLVTRLKMDAMFTCALTAIPNQRISTFRGSIKKATDAHVIAFYQLNPTTCSEKYEKRTVPWSKPYQHPAVAAVLHACFWTGTQSFANRYPTQFTSSMLSRPLEREVPAPMLALIGAALHASLLEWKSGMHRAAAFSGDAFVDVYNEHCLLLAGIRKQNPHAYHTMMHRMYNHASGIWTPTAANTVGGAGGPIDNALAHVDINAMDID
ncbi:hypothetical protein BD413DRAFT_612966 [Trametes elegans]|nr:hypothetical protein BD413DRAFT_612966 [Trametes elegans]